MKIADEAVTATKATVIACMYRFETILFLFVANNYFPAVTSLAHNLCGQETMVGTMLGAVSRNYVLLDVALF